MVWLVKKLGDVCNIVGGGTPSKSNDSFYEGDIPWATVRDMRNDRLSRTEMSITEEAIKRSSTNLIPSGTIITATRVGLGKVCVLEQDTAINQDLKAIIPKTKELDNTFLYWWLKSIAHKIVAAGTGATVQGVKLTFVKALEIPLPPIPEQKRIVALLDTVFADLEQTRAKTEQNLKNARELFDSYLQQVFSQKGEGCEQVPLSKITESISDGDHSAPPKSDEGIPFITISNIDKKTHEIDFSNTFKVPEEYYSSLKPHRQPKAGDVLYTVTGSYGIPVIVKEDKDFCFQRHIGLVRPDKGINSQWLYHLLMSPQVFNQADSGATGTAQKTVSLKLLRGILVPNIPLSTQEEMVEGLDYIYEKSNSLENIYTEKLMALDELKKSILQKAFSGELTASAD